MMLTHTGEEIVAKCRRRRVVVLCCEVLFIQGEKVGEKKICLIVRGGWGGMVEKLLPPATLRVTGVIRSPFPSVVLIDDHSLFRADAL